MHLPDEPLSATRRKFLGACGSCGVAMLGLSTSLLASCASLVARRVPTVDGRVELAIRQYPELMEPGGSLKILPDGHDDPIILTSHADGSISALSSTCTHLGCVVNVESDRLVCPCHGSTFDRRGAVLKGPAESSLAKYRVTTSTAGLLTIDLRSAQ